MYQQRFDAKELEEFYNSGIYCKDNPNGKVELTSEMRLRPLDSTATYFTFGSYKNPLEFTIEEEEDNIVGIIKIIEYPPKSKNYNKNEYQICKAGRALEQCQDSVVVSKSKQLFYLDKESGFPCIKMLVKLKVLITIQNNQTKYLNLTKIYELVGKLDNGSLRCKPFKFSNDDDYKIVFNKPLKGWVEGFVSIDVTKEWGSTFKLTKIFLIE